MSRIKLKSGFLFFPVFLFLTSCKESNRELINDSLGIEIPANSKGIEYYEDNKTPDSRRPYNKFIKFSVDTIGLHEIITKTNLISNKGDFKKNMCLKNTDNFFIKKLWSFESGNFIKVDESLRNKLNWWNPDDEKNSQLYASFYKERGSPKIENCYLNEWDGRILLGYSEQKKIVYILIEVYMENESSPCP